MQTRAHALFGGDGCDLGGDSSKRSVGKKGCNGEVDQVGMKNKSNQRPPCPHLRTHERGRGKRDEGAGGRERKCEGEGV